MSSHSLERVTGALARAQQHWKERSLEAAARGESSVAPDGLSIALMREAGTSGPLVAREVGARLGWPVYDHELLELIAREMGLRVSLLESLDERRQSWLRETLESFALVRTVSESAYVRHLIETILSLGAHGECVIVGRGAALILPAKTTVRIRLVAPLEERITEFSRRFGLSRAEAARQVEATDRERTRFIKDHFLQDPNNPHLYDLVLNTWRWSVSEAAQLIIDALQPLRARLGQDASV
jgi:cytidylate kinase